LRFFFFAYQRACPPQSRLAVNSETACVLLYGTNMGHMTYVGHTYILQ